MKNEMVSPELGRYKILAAYSGGVSVSRAEVAVVVCCRESGQINRLRKNDFRAKYNFLRVPPRESWPLDVNCQMHKHIGRDTQLVCTLKKKNRTKKIYFKRSCFQQQQQQKPQMLVQRNEANKTNLIANKLPSEFSWIFPLQGFSRREEKTRQEGRKKASTCCDTPNAALATPVGLIGFPDIQKKKKRAKFGQSLQIKVEKPE